MLFLQCRKIIYESKIKYICKPWFLSYRNRISTTVELKKTVHDEYLWGSDSSAVNLVNKHFKVYENFISELEEENFLKEIEPIFKRRRYQFDHWDGAIQGYKETEKEEWNEGNSKVIQRLRKIAFPAESVPIKHIHVLDLAKTGHIKPHIDSVKVLMPVTKGCDLVTSKRSMDSDYAKFCGSIIAGISLLSTSIMRLVMEQNKTVVVDALLPRRSLYILSRLVRYEFTHEILDETASIFKGFAVPRERRVSIICRNEPEDQSKNEC